MHPPGASDRKSGSAPPPNNRLSDDKLKRPSGILSGRTASRTSCQPPRVGSLPPPVRYLRKRSDSGNRAGPKAAQYTDADADSAKVPYSAAPLKIREQRIKRVRHAFKPGEIDFVRLQQPAFESVPCYCRGAFPAASITTPSSGRSSMPPRASSPWRSRCDDSRSVPASLSGNFASAAAIPRLSATSKRS